MVDGQINAPLPPRRAVRQQVLGGHISADHRVRREAVRGRQPLQIAPHQDGGVLVVQHIGGFAQLPQGAAQPRGAADGVPVGPLVG